MIKLALLLLAVSAQAKPRAPRPGAEELILRALSGPATSYSAVERVQVFLPGKKPKALKAELSVLPDGRQRREIRGGRSKKAMIELRADAEPARKGYDRLASLYDMTVSTGGVVAKRKTWKVALVLKKNGRLRRALWVDRDSGLLMKRETYRDDGSLAKRERLASLTMPAAADPASFAGAAPAKPWTPAGFMFVSEDKAGRRYSNGLESYAIAGGAVAGDLAEDDAERVLGR